jgi:hypothetical protein
MKKQFKRQQEETQIQWKSTNHDAPFNPYRKYYTLIEIDGGEQVFDYIGKFRSEALTHFEEQARINHGRLTSSVQVYK